MVAQIVAAAAVTAVMCGAGPRRSTRTSFPTSSPLTDATSGEATLIAMLISMAVGAVLVVPCLIALYAVFQRDEVFGADRHERTEGH